MQLVDKVEYDMKKFIHIGYAQSSPGFFFVKSDSAIKSLADLKTFGKPIRHAVFSPTAPLNVALISLSKQEKFPMAVVGGFTATPAMILSLLRGEVELAGSSMPGATQFVKNAQIRPILTVSPTRAPEFPDVPTVGEIGYPSLAYLGLEYWFMAPPGTSPDRVKILDDALLKTVKDPEFIAWAKNAGVDPLALNSADSTKRVMGLISTLEGLKEDVEKFLKK
jgi:tripartite-type tricarboxylate transporter receptor subunit TctC